MTRCIAERVPGVDWHPRWAVAVPEPVLSTSTLQARVEAMVTPAFVSSCLCTLQAHSGPSAEARAALVALLLQGLQAGAKAAAHAPPALASASASSSSSSSAAGVGAVDADPEARAGAGVVGSNTSHSSAGGSLAARRAGRGPAAAEAEGARKRPPRSPATAVSPTLNPALLALVEASAAVEGGEGTGDGEGPGQPPADGRRVSKRKRVARRAADAEEEEACSRPAAASSSARRSRTVAAATGTHVAPLPSSSVAATASSSALVAAAAAAPAPCASSGPPAAPLGPCTSSAYAGVWYPVGSMADAARSLTYRRMDDISSQGSSGLSQHLQGPPEAPYYAPPAAAPGVPVCQPVVPPCSVAAAYPAAGPSVPCHAAHGYVSAPAAAPQALQGPPLHRVPPELSHLLHSTAAGPLPGLQRAAGALGRAPSGNYSQTYEASGSQGGFSLPALDAGQEGHTAADGVYLSPPGLPAAVAAAFPYAYAPFGAAGSGGGPVIHVTSMGASLHSTSAGVPLFSTARPPQLAGTNHVTRAAILMEPSATGAIAAAMRLHSGIGRAPSG
jgi:hypothetical protein